MPQSAFCPRHWRHSAILLLTVTFLSNHTSAQDAATAWRADPAAVEAFQKRRSEFNVDESKVPEYKLPDVLASSDRGSRITDASTWLKTHRPRLLQTFRETVYGVRPTTPFQISYHQTGQASGLFGIDATAKQIKTTIKTERGEHSFEFVLFLPKSDAPAPVIVQINKRFFLPMRQASD